jgi:hypothetical protein
VSFLSFCPFMVWQTTPQGGSAQIT